MGVVMLGIEPTPLESNINPFPLPTLLEALCCQVVASMWLNSYRDYYFQHSARLDPTIALLANWKRREGRTALTAQWRGSTHEEREDVCWSANKNTHARGQPPSHYSSSSSLDYLRIQLRDLLRIFLRKILRNSAHLKKTQKHTWTIQRKRP